MEKKVLLGIQKKKRPSKRNKKKLVNKVIDYLLSDSYLFAPLISSSPSGKKLVNKVIDYLLSDSYLFAPLISSSPSGFRLPHNSAVSSASVKLKEAVKGNNKGFVKKVEEYLKSDSYMYASLVVPPQSNGPMWYCKSVTTEVSMRTSTLEDHQLTVEVEKGQDSKDHSAKKVLSDQQTSVRKETVKRMIYQNCRSSSMSGKGMLGSQLRKLC